jgi:tetratricopeptide (TPR) repeat protein
MHMKKPSFLLALTLVLNMVPAAFAADVAGPPAEKTPDSKVEAKTEAKTEAKPEDAKQEAVAPTIPLTRKEVAKPLKPKDVATRNKAIPVYNQGVSLYEQKKYDLALQKFQEAAKIDPTYSFPHTNMSMLYYFQRDWKNALSQIEQALKLDPANETPSPLVNAGLFASNCGLYDKAMRYFNLALEYAPDDDVVYMDRGNLYLRMNQPQKALADYNTALQFNPKNPQALENKQLLEDNKWSGKFENVLIDSKSGGNARLTPLVKKPGTAPTATATAPKKGK